MAKTRDQKEVILDGYKAKISATTGVIVIDHKGLTAAEVTEFKKKMVDVGGSYNVIKNTVFNMALDQSGLPKLDIIKSGAHAAVFIGGDISATAKLLQDFMKETKDKIQLKTGMLEGQIINANQISELANMPTKDQSVAMIAGLLTNALSGVANVLEDSVRSVAIIINQAFTE